MSLPSPQTAAAADLDPAILEPLLDMIMDSSPALPNDTEKDRATRRNVARLAVLALRPTDPFQAMLAAQTVAGHYAIMDAFRRAAPLDVPDNVAARLRSNAVSLTRTMHATMRRLREQQGLIAPKPAKPPAAAAITSITEKVARSTMTSTSLSRCGSSEPAVHSLPKNDLSRLRGV